MEEDFDYEIEQDITKNQIQPNQSLKKAHTNSIDCLAAHPKDNVFASGSHDKTIKIWDINQNKEKMTLSDHKEGVWSLQYSSNGTKLLSGSPDQSVILWDSIKGSPGCKFIGHKGKVYCARFSPDNSQIISVGSQNELFVWDPRDQTKPLQSIIMPAPIGYHLHWPQNSQLILIPTYQAKLLVYNRKFNLLTSEQVTKYIAEQEQQIPKCQSCTANFNTIPGRIFCATDKGIIAWYQYNESTKKLKKQTQFRAHMDGCRNTILHPSKKLLLTTSRDGSIRLWDCGKKQWPSIVCNLVLHCENVTSALFMHDKYIVTGSWDQSIGIWSTKDLNL